MGDIESLQFKVVPRSTTYTIVRNATRGTSRRQKEKQHLVIYGFELDDFTCAKN